MRKLMMAPLLAMLILSATAVAQDILKIGWIDPLSGGGASVGERGLKCFQFLADELNANGGVLGKQVEIVPFDNKVNPRESLIPGAEGDRCRDSCPDARQRLVSCRRADGFCH
jgi:branched-chain amino acid transport system substrate-binding protein